LGISAKRTLEDVIKGECSLQEVLVDGPAGLKIVPASSGVQSMVSLGEQQHAGLIHAFSDLSEQIDVLIIDTAAGISDLVINFVRAAQEVIVVVCDEPSSITDAYALIKLLNTSYDVFKFRVLANQTNSPQEGKNLFAKLLQVTDRFLDVTLQYVGQIPYDETLKKAVQRQRAVVDIAPRSKSGMAFKALAQKVDEWPLPSSPRGHLEFFVESLVQGAVRH
jgi:flagellar biosynthesis protein FlhG